MKKVIGAINMTLDGYCDHTSITPDEEIHRHYEVLLNGGDAVLYGRITYQLMEFWPGLLENPSGIKSMDEFAVSIDRIPKIVFSNTLRPDEIWWRNSRLAKQSLEEEIIQLKSSLPAPGGLGSKDILIGSPSLIIAALNLGLIDEFQLCVHPVVAGAGQPLFRNLKDRIRFELLKTKTFGSGAVIFFYAPSMK